MMKMDQKKRILTGITVKTVMALMTLGLFAGIGNAEGVKIVSIDTGRVVQAHPAFVEAQETFQGKIQEMQAALAELDEAEQQVQGMQMQQELQQLGREMQEAAFAEFTKDLTEIATENGYDLMVGKEGILVGEAQEDVTEQVLETFPARPAPTPSPAPVQPQAPVN